MTNKFFVKQASCDLDVNTPWRLMEICEWWKADTASYCQPKTAKNEQFPSNLSFTGVLLLSKTMAEHECVYMRLNHIEVPNGKGGGKTDPKHVTSHTCL